MLTNLRATQLGAKLKHARARLQTIETAVGDGLPDPAATGKEYADVMRYLRSIEDEIVAAVAEDA
jgi:hypothetical protein